MTARREPPPTLPCPACGAGLQATVPPACPWCGVPVGGDTGRRLVAVDQRIAELGTQRAQLLTRLHAEAAVGIDWAPPAPSDAPPTTTAVEDADRAGELPGLRGWLATAGPQTLLASSGVLLLAIAAVVFAAVTWRDLSVLTRGGVLVVASTVSAQLTRTLVRRGLRRSAEATGVLTLALLAVLLNGLWRAGLLDRVGDDGVVLTVATGLLAVAAHVLARMTTVRSALVLAAWLASAAVVTSGQPLADALSRLGLPMLAPQLSLAAVLGGAVVGALHADRFLTDLTIWREGTQVAATLLWLSAVIGMAIVLAESLAPPPLTMPFVVTLLLVGAAVLAAACARRLNGHAPRWDAAGVVGMWFAATIGVSAALLDRVELWPDATVVLPLIAGTAALQLLPGHRARVWAVAGMAPVTLMAQTPVLEVIAWVCEVISWRIDAPWTAPAIDVAQRAPVDATVLSAVVVVTVTAVLAARIGRAAAAAVYAATIGGLLAVAVGVLLWPAVGGAIVGVVLVACAAGGLRGASRPLPAAIALVVASGVTAMVALSSAAVTITTLAVMAAVSLVALPGPGDRARALAAAVVTADIIAVAAAITAATTDGYGPVGVTVALAAACGWVVAAGIVRRPVRSLAVEVTAGAGFACAVGTAAEASAVWSAVVLGVLAVAAAGVAVWRDDRAWLQWVATAAASASSWLLLSDYDVRLVEAYTMPPAVLIVALGASGLRARPMGSSWPVMGSGLTLLTMPTVLQLLSEPADLRRLAVAVALGSALVVIGRVVALQSPLAVGVGVLVLVALSQYDALTELLPRWLLLAAAGTLLLWLSISYERQRARVSAATRRLTAMR